MPAMPMPMVVVVVVEEEEEEGAERLLPYHMAYPSAASVAKEEEEEVVVVVDVGRRGWGSGRREGVGEGERWVRRLLLKLLRVGVRVKEEGEGGVLLLEEEEERARRWRAPCVCCWLLGWDVSLLCIYIHIYIYMQAR
jgi:hypothetical protein